MPDQLNEYAVAGFDGHMTKPIEIDRLYGAIAAALQPEIAEAA